MSSEIFALIIGALALVYAFLAFRMVKKVQLVDAKVVEITGMIRAGAMAFLKREYRVLGIFVAVLAVVLALALDKGETAVHEGLYTAIAFVFGALCSGLAGNIGMRTATMGNGRTTEAAKEGFGKAFTIAFRSGSVMGMSVAGLGIMGLALLLMIYKNIPGLEGVGMIDAVGGFGLGAASIALFARVGGGIYTKAADVGADLVGKVEAGIPEDDPRNPAVIADNVGDNVGDIAGMGADLFDSFVVSTIAAMVVGFTTYGMDGVLLPLVLMTMGIIASGVGVAVSRAKDLPQLGRALRIGMIVAAIVVILTAYFAIRYFFPFDAVGMYIAVVAGLLVGVAIGLLTEYYTSGSYKPVKNLAAASQTGAGTNLISGLALGYQSTLLPIAVICLGIFVSYYFAGLYGITLAAVGMLSISAIALTVDAYGPVADNAGGIAEMSGMGPDVRKRTDALDAAGNTTAAIGKGFAIGSAGLTALGLFSAFASSTGLTSINVLDYKVIIGLLLGGMIPYLFSSLTMAAVGKAAYAIIAEVRRQFKEIPGLMQGTAKGDPAKCVDIVTAAAIRQMVVPGILAIGVPLAVGLTLGAAALGGLLSGVLVSGMMLAISMSNSGGAWDNAKKFIEAGNYGGKGSDVHKAAVVGDTVGDPFKDTSGPSLNILIKLMTIVSLVFAMLFV